MGCRSYQPQLGFARPGARFPNSIYLTALNHPFPWLGGNEGSSWTWSQGPKVKRNRGKGMVYTMFILGVSSQTRVQLLESRSRVWKTFNHENVARFHGLMACSEGMPALVLNFYPNGNINEFLRTRDPKPKDVIKLTLVLCHVSSFLSVFLPDTVSIGYGDRTWYAIPPRIRPTRCPRRYSRCECRTSEPNHF